jgi:hypothetical protein
LPMKMSNVLQVGRSSIRQALFCVTDDLPLPRLAR